MDLSRAKRVARKKNESVVFEYFAQFLFQLPLSEYVFHAAPCRLAAFGGGHGLGAPFRALNQGIEVVRLFGFPEKLIVDIEMFVCAFAHCSRKAPEINRIDQLGIMKLRTIADSVRHSTSATTILKVMTGARQVWLQPVRGGSYTLFYQWFSAHIACSLSTSALRCRCAPIRRAPAKRPVRRLY